MSKIALALLGLLVAVVRVVAVQVMKLLAWTIVLLVAMMIAVDGASMVATEVRGLLRGAIDAQMGRQLRDVAWRWAVGQRPRFPGVPCLAAFCSNIHQFRSAK